ncbi:MAG: bifunctional glycosyltransferase family 2/GtrA family protein [Ancrocorticia sp.]
MIVLIPSLEPDHRLPELVRLLRGELGGEARESGELSGSRELRGEVNGVRILIVDDGSGPAYEGTFADAAAEGAVVIGYPTNRGKGFALRHGFEWCLANAPGETVVCADSDGQHTPADIARVAAESERNPEALVLGVRGFVGDVPLRSRFGNAMSALVFRLASGVRVDDTQTGLRAYGARQLPELLEVPGDRFEWEQNALLMAARSGREIVQVPIATVYLDENSSSHFRPLADSYRVFRSLLGGVRAGVMGGAGGLSAGVRAGGLSVGVGSGVLKFAGSGLVAWALEMVLFLLLQVHIGVVWAVVLARLTSASMNFLMNKFAVFGERSRENTRRQAVGYVALAAVLLVTTAVGVRVLTSIGLAAWLAKLVMDVSGLAVSFRVQSRVIFTEGSGTEVVSAR